MSLLAPLYALAALAIAAPILLHLIRRQPKGEVEFSSLMFLDATPPKLTRRSRLENWPLLLLRCLAILLLAFAFARPFLPSTDTSQSEGQTRAVVLLIDQSASMRREGCWQQAIQQATAIIENAPPETIFSVIGFDSSATTVASIRESAEMDATSRRKTAIEALQQLQPGWGTTDMGSAIRFAADQVSNVESVFSSESDAENSDFRLLETQLVLVSDLQSGADLDSLQGYPWPERVWLDIRQIEGPRRGNATLRIATDELSSDDKIEDADQDQIRVQVTNSGDSDQRDFALRFRDQADNAATIQVDAGQTRFVRVDLPPMVEESTEDKKRVESQGYCLELFGDNVPFDNQSYLLRRKRLTQSIWFLDSMANAIIDDGSKLTVQDDTNLSPEQSLAFFAQQIPWSDPAREITFETQTFQQWPKVWDPELVPFVILGDLPTEDDRLATIRAYRDAGGRVLVICDGIPLPTTTRSLGVLLDSPELTVLPVESEPKPNNQFALINNVDFNDPLIRPLSQPGTNDFSNLRIWRHWQLVGLSPDVETVLSLDNESPLLIRNHGGQGRLWVLTTGWQPANSQFALSTKFVPILLGMLGASRSRSAASYVVGQRIDDQTRATEPGFLQTSDGQSHAVNLAAEESDTEPFDRDQFTQYGAVVSSPQLQASDKTAKRALRDQEIESRQGIWRWLILATLGFVAAETLLATRQTSQDSPS